MNIVTITKSVGMVVISVLSAMTGGWFIWQWLRSGRSIVLGSLGCILLLFSRIILVYQPVNFGRVYAAYGGLFIILALIWGWGIDGVTPDRWDIIGALLCSFGVIIIMYAPR